MKSGICACLSANNIFFDQFTYYINTYKYHINDKKMKNHNNIILAISWHRSYPMLILAQRLKQYNHVHWIRQKHIAYLLVN